MKILFTGGGSGGHFYPILSIVEELNTLIREQKLLGVKMYYMAPTPYNPGVLFDNNLIYKKNSAGKLRGYFSILNFFDLFKTGWGILISLWSIFVVYPDVVFGKGGYASFPALCAARVLRIPVIIHESDTVPGRVNKWAGKFAKKIALSYKESASFFPQEKIVYTGNPIRRELMEPTTLGASEFFKLEAGIPTILILGGSQGSQIINDNIIDALPELIKHYQIIHQTGKGNLKEVLGRAGIVLSNNQFAERYKPFDYLDTSKMRMAAGVAELVISRAGSAIFEISSWGIPSIIIPITKSNGDHQRKNAFAYARGGACIVIEESNLAPNILVSEVDRLMNNNAQKQSMRDAAKAFGKKDAAKIIAKGILDTALAHEK